MHLVSNYMRDDALRHALNDLTKKTFGFDFESWVTGGYFEGDYIPFSFIEDGKIILHEETDELLANFGVLKVTKEQYGQLDRQYILRRRKEI